MKMRVSDITRPYLILRMCCVCVRGMAYHSSEFFFIPLEPECDIAYIHTDTYIHTYIHVTGFFIDYE
jgi:hypothetical protein